MEIVVTAWQPLAARLIHGFESCAAKRPDGRYDAYPDPGSRDGTPWTIGWGSTGPDIKKGTVWTQTQCDARFAEDLTKFGTLVANAIGDAPTSANQMAALVSFAYNVGVSALKSSTLLRKHLAGDFAGAAAQFARWNKNDGKVMKGLTRRRAAEAALYARQENTHGLAS